MEERRWYVYVHYEDDIDKPFYAGKGTEYRYKAKHTSGDYIKYVANIKKEIQKKIIYDNLTFTEANNIEIETIKKYGRIKYEKNGILVNLTLGGGGFRGYAYKRKPETIQKLKNSLKGVNKGRQPANKEQLLYYAKQPRSQKWKDNISKANKGQVPVLKGKTLEELIGKERADQTKKLLSQSKKGKTLEQIYGIEQAKKIRQTLSTNGIGKIPWNKGKGKTKEEKQQRTRDYQQKNKERLKAYQKEYYLNNKEKWLNYK